MVFFSLQFAIGTLMDDYLGKFNNMLQFHLFFLVKLPPFFWLHQVGSLLGFVAHCHKAIWDKFVEFCQTGAWCNLWCHHIVECFLVFVGYCHSQSFQLLNFVPKYILWVNCSVDKSVTWRLMDIAFGFEYTVHAEPQAMYNFHFISQNAGVQVLTFYIHVTSSSID